MVDIPGLQYLASISYNTFSKESWIEYSLLQNIMLHVSTAPNIAVESTSSGDMNQIACKLQWKYLAVSLKPR